LPKALDYYKSNHEAIEQHQLITVDFTSLNEYLALLKLISKNLQKTGARAMLYLAAAVSDFYIPENELAEHKIQSSSGSLNLSLKLVPKELKPLVQFIVPDAFVVSFKLETDVNLLVEKSRRSLDTYKHQLVIGNLLNSRRTSVILLTADGQLEEIQLSLEDQENSLKIEQKIVERVVDLHDKHIRNHSMPKSSI